MEEALPKLTVSLRIARFVLIHLWSLRSLSGEVTGHQAQEHGGVNGLSEQGPEFVLREGSQQAPGELFALDRHDADGRILRDGGAELRTDQQAAVTRERGGADAGAEVKGRGDVRHHREMRRVMATGARNVQQELFHDHARDGPIVLHAGPLNARGGQACGEPEGREGKHTDSQRLRHNFVRVVGR